MRNKPERMIGMKKFKKVIAMCLTAAMALSMMSIGAFAAEIEPNTTTAIVTNADGSTESVELNINIPDNATADEINNILYQAAKSAIADDSAVAPAALPTTGATMVLCGSRTIRSNNYPVYSNTQLGGFTLPYSVTRLGIGLVGVSDPYAKINLRIHNTTNTNNANDPYILGQSVAIPDYDCLFTFIDGYTYNGSEAVFSPNSSWLVYASVEGSPCTIDGALAFLNY